MPQQQMTIPKLVTSMSTNLLKCYPKITNVLWPWGFFYLCLTSQSILILEPHQQTIITLQILLCILSSANQIPPCSTTKKCHSAAQHTFSAVPKTPQRNTKYFPRSAKQILHCSTTVCCIVPFLTPSTDSHTIPIHTPSPLATVLFLPKRKN